VANSKLAHVQWLYLPGHTRTKNTVLKVVDGQLQEKTEETTQTTQWGTAVTLTLTFEDQSALNPGVSLMTPFENSVKTFPVGGNVTSPQSFSLGLGVAGTANATRTETIQFTYPNQDLLSWADKQFKSDPETCEKTNKGIAIASNLKIDDFIYDKASIASLGNDIGKVSPDSPPFNTFQEQITFVASYGGNVTPTWKFARISADPTGTLLTATRTNTDSLTITLGDVTPATLTSPAQLKTAGQNLNNAGVGGTLFGTQGKGTSP
jgi:hypothetical protein